MQRCVRRARLTRAFAARVKEKKSCKLARQRQDLETQGILGVIMAGSCRIAHFVSGPNGIYQALHRNIVQ